MADDSDNGGDLDVQIQHMDEEEGQEDSVADETNSTSTSTLATTRISKTKPFSNPVHQWFNDYGKDSKCIICSKVLTGRYPTTLKNHLKSHHAQYKKFQQLQKSHTDSAKLRKKPQTNSEISSLQRNLEPEDEQSQQNSNGGAFAAAMAAITQRRRSNQAETPTDSVDKELKDYLDELVNSSISTSENPFEFWCRRASKYTELLSISVDVLAIPATSAPTERIFSQASFLLTRKRHNLDDEKLESELFYKVNSRFLD